MSKYRNEEVTVVRDLAAGDAEFASQYDANTAKVVIRNNASGAVSVAVKSAVS